MPLMNVCIPENIRFSDLRLARDADGMVSFDWTPIDAICKASGIDPSFFRETQEELIAEALAEDAFGGGFSYPPGSA